MTTTSIMGERDAYHDEQKGLDNCQVVIADLSALDVPVLGVLLCLGSNLPDSQAVCDATALGCHSGIDGDASSGSAGGVGNVDNGLGDAVSNGAKMLRQALQMLEALDGVLGVSVAEMVVSPDFTGRTDAIYHNVCALLTLAKPDVLPALTERFVEIERCCGRVRNGQSATMTKQVQVALDIDVLAASDEKGRWHVSRRRLPFKAHEQSGVMRLVPCLFIKSEKSEMAIG